MTTDTKTPADDPVIFMSRLFEAPPEIVFEAFSKPEHVAQWWGGHGFTNPVCEMDFRPGGIWKQVMRHESGFEMTLLSEFIEIVPPVRIIWRQFDDSKAPHRAPLSYTLTFETAGAKQTRWTLVARFEETAERDKAAQMGFADMIGQSNERLAAYLPSLMGATQ